MICFYFFFFSSRRRHTRLQGDWSSDVCSSDLQGGGTGVALDPARAAGLPAARLFVAGGLRPDTVAEVVRALRPFAVDVASGVEASPGRKDHAKVEEFIRRAKAA